MSRIIRESTGEGVCVCGFLVTKTKQAQGWQVKSRLLLPAPSWHSPVRPGSECSGDALFSSDTHVLIARTSTAMHLTLHMTRSAIAIRPRRQDVAAWIATDAAKTVGRNGSFDCVCKTELTSRSFSEITGRKSSLRIDHRHSRATNSL